MTGPILVTTAPNDDDLFSSLNATGMATRMAIQFGDVNHYGLWTGNQVITVCGERKKTMDLVGCIRSSGRHLQQIRESFAHHDRTYLIWEQTPEIRRSSDGLIEIKGLHAAGKKGLSLWNTIYDAGLGPNLPWAQFQGYLHQLPAYLGVQVVRTRGLQDTVEQIIAIHSMYQQPPEAHSSLQKFYQPPLVHDYLEQPSLLRRMAKELSGIGWETSKGLDDKYRTGEMFNDAVMWGDLTEVDGIGKKTAESIKKEWTTRG